MSGVEQLTAQQKFLANIARNKAKADKGEYKIQPVDKRDQGVLDSSLSQDLFVNVFNQVLDPKMLDQLNNLKPGDSINIKRPPNSKDIRTFNICMDEKGEIYLFIEPKSKRFDNTRRRLKWRGGSYKTRKIAVRADTEEAQAYVSMIEYVKNEEKAKERVKNELECAQKFCGLPGFARHYISGGSKVKMKNGREMLRMITYSPYKPSDLYEFLKGDWVPPGVKFSDDGTELKALKYDVMRQVIEIIATMHKQHIAHSDLKPENFLIEYNYETARFDVQIIDFGFARDFKELDEGLGTGFYMAPWLIKMVSAGRTVPGLERGQDRQAEKFRKNYMPSLGWTILRPTLPANDPIRLNPSVKNYGAHDIWALGIIGHDIMHGLNEQGEDLEKNIRRTTFLQSIFKLKADPLENVKRNNMSSITAVRQFFDEDAEIKEALLHLPVPLQHVYDPNIVVPQHEDEDRDFIDKLNIRDFPKRLIEMENYVEKMGQLLGQSYPAVGEEQKIQIAKDILLMSPIGAEVDIMSSGQFNIHFDGKDPKDTAYRSGYKQLKKFVDFMTKPQNQKDLQKYADEIRVLVDKCMLDFPNQATDGRLSKDDWLEFKRWELFLRTALCLTYMRINAMQNQTIVKKPQTSWLLGTRLSSGFYGMLRQRSNAKKTPQLNFTSEIADQKQIINKILSGIKLELNPKNFETEFARRNP